MSPSFLNDVIRWTKTILLLVIQLQSHIDFNHKSSCLLWNIILHLNTAISLKIQVHQDPTILMTSYAWDFIMNLDCSTYWWRQFCSVVEVFSLDRFHFLDFLAGRVEAVVRHVAGIEPETSGGHPSRVRQDFGPQVGSSRPQERRTQSGLGSAILNL